MLIEVDPARVANDGAANVRKRRQENSSIRSDFIVGNLSRSIIENNDSIFVVGDNKTYGEYRNKPLTEGDVYSVRVAHASCIPEVSEIFDSDIGYPI